MNQDSRHCSSQVLRHGRISDPNIGESWVCLVIRLSEAILSSLETLKMTIWDSIEDSWPPSSEKCSWESELFLIMLINLFQWMILSTCTPIHIWTSNKRWNNVFIICFVILELKRISLILTFKQRFKITQNMSNGQT